MNIQTNRLDARCSLASSIFILILFLCKQLTDLNFHLQLNGRYPCISIYNSSPVPLSSSTLTKLKVSVTFFDDCLYILDERFQSLSILIIFVKEISTSALNIDKTVIIVSIILF